MTLAVPPLSYQREQGYWNRPTAHQQSAQYRFEDGSQHLAAEQNLSRSAIPSIANQARGSHRDQGHGGQAGPFDLPHAALRDEIRGPRSGLLRASTPAFTDQAAQMESRQAGIPNRRSPGRLSRSFWGVRKYDALEPVSFLVARHHGAHSGRKRDGCRAAFSH